MVELLYPVGLAPVIGGRQESASEMLPIVEPNGIVTGQASRSWCHTSNLLHPVVHMYIIDRYSKVFLQKRSDNKETWPGKWDMAVGGHVSYGEQIETALYREASEELNLYDFNPQYLKTFVLENGNESELVNLYACVGHFDLEPDNYEVSDGRYWTMEEIEAGLGHDIFTPFFEREFPEIKEMLLSLL